MQEKEIDLGDLFKAIGKDLFKNILFGLIFAGVIFAVSSFLITPKYQATTSLIINNEKNNQDNDININDIQLNQKLVSTYKELIQTRGVATQVIKNLQLPMTYEQFKEEISIDTKNDTEVFEVKVVDANPERAMDIANETSKVFKSAIVKVLNVDNVQILDKAILPENPISPNVTKNTILSFLIAFIIMNFVTIIRVISDTTIKDEEDIVNNFDIPVIGIVPNRKGER